MRIRNQATVGGNLAHADPAQDPPPMLIALDGQAVIASRAGERRVPLDEFFVDYFETALQPGEVLVSVDLPPCRLDPGHLQEVLAADAGRLRHGVGGRGAAHRCRWPVRGRAGGARRGGDDAGAGAQRRDALRGNRIDASSVKEASALVRDEVDPLDDLRGSAGYKREMARVWTKRALLELLDGGARGASGGWG